MPRTREVVYWDTVAFLGLLNRITEPENCDLCEDVWAAAQAGKMFIMTSTLTVAEVVYLKGTPKLDPSKRPSINKFFQNPFLIQKPLTRIIAELARDIVWDSSVKPKDAIHVATAGYYRVSILHTFDDGLLNQGTIDVNGFTVIIRKPYAQKQIEMFPK